MPDKLAEEMIEKAKEACDCEECDRALEAASDLLEIDPNDGISWYIMARALMCAGNFDDALEAVDRAIEMDSSLVGPLRLKGHILFAMGNFTEATEPLLRVMAKDSKDLEAAYLLSSCYLLLGDEVKAKQFAIAAAKIDLGGTVAAAKKFYETIFIQSTNVSQDQKNRTLKTLNELEAVVKAKGGKKGDEE
ncbi:Tetratricopeptide repeat protein [Candidatus Gugararchaeum adminiculabundum]|nr:Tetratricopeptide repeat protein [Candidatus Gugararchaeum adminiculabundum]